MATTTAPPISPVEAKMETDSPADDMVLSDAALSLKRERTDGDANPAPMKKKKVRKIIFSNPNPGDQLVLFHHVPKEALVDLVQQVDGRTNPQGEVTSAKILERNQVRIGPSAAEVAKFKKEYLDEYRSRETTIQRRKQKASDPAEIAKKQAYAAREDVKKRKREVARKTRLFKKTIQANYPDIHEKGMSLIEKTYDFNSDSSSDSSSSDDNSTD